MSQYQHIQFAGLHDDAPLIDVPSLPAGGPIPRWVPETDHDEFWGVNWTNWKPPPPPSHADNIQQPADSLLDGPIEEPRYAAATELQHVTSVAHALRTTSRSSSNDSDSDNNDTSTVPQNPTNRQQRRLPDELDAIVLQPAPRDTTETVDRIFNYLANPPRRRRFVSDEAWDMLGTARLPAMVERHVKLFRYLVRENGELLRQTRQVNDDAPRMGGMGVEALAWAQDEHLDVTLVAEKSTKELSTASREALLDHLQVVELAREDLLQMNDEMKRQMEDWHKR